MLNICYLNTYPKRKIAKHLKNVFKKRQQIVCEALCLGPKHYVCSVYMFILFNMPFELVQIVRAVLLNFFIHCQYYTEFLYLVILIQFGFLKFSSEIV